MSVAQTDETVQVHDELWPHRVRITSDKLHVLWAEQFHGRIQCGTQLALEQDRVIIAGGRWRVKDEDGKWQTVNGTCTCRDFKDQIAPQGFCKHRFAALITREAQMIPDEELAVNPATYGQEESIAEESIDPDEEARGKPDNEDSAWSEDTRAVPAAPERGQTQPALPEAAFSLCLRGTLGGQDAQITIRGATAEAFRANLREARAALNEARGLLDPLPEPSPAPAESEDVTYAVPPGDPQETGWCPVHAVQMPKTTKEGQSWFSHRLPDRSWCKGREVKK